ncbi:MAG: outer membrane protein TolC [Myxococcota bacterium]|jgi:outer membrane protein TolC
MMFALLLSLFALAAPLPLETVLTAVDDHLPALAAQAAKLEAAEAKLLAARGAFDPTLSGKTSRYDGSDSRSLSVLSVGGETVLGPRWSAGIRQSEGYVKPYETELETGADGEWFARAEVPLDGLILSDSRARLLTAQQAVGIAGSVLDDKRLALRYKASSAYWKWVISGQKAEIEQSQLDLASGRIAALTRQVEEGSAAEMDLIDGRQSLLERQARVINARAEVDIAAQRLALYYRDDRGIPIKASAEQLPELTTPQSSPELAALIEQARSRPDLIALDHAIETARIALRQQQLALLPGATVVGQVAEDVALGKTEWLIGAEVKMPLLLRKARGSRSAAEAEQTRLEAERQWLLDQIDAELSAAWMSAEAARQQADLMAQTVEQAQRVLGMEQTRYDLGGSDLFKIILREDKLAEVRKYLATAQADAQLRQAALRQAAGVQ